MIARQKQVALFENLIEKQGDKNRFVASLSEILSISRDGVYRRLRGETPLTIDDLELLSREFYFSVDEMLQENNPGLLTRYEAFEQFEWERFLSHVKASLQYHLGQGPFSVFYNAKEIPIFYLFQFPELMAFKCYFWDYTFFTQQKLPPFNPNSLQLSARKLSSEVQQLYGNIPSNELWGKEIFSATLKQIVYFHEIDELSRDQAQLLMEKMMELVEFLDEMASEGRKTYAEKPAEVNIYINELLIGDNTLVVESDSGLRAYLSQNIISSVIVDDQNYCRHTLKTYQTIARKSTLISSSSEKNRKKFFKQLRAEIQEYWGML